jgi:SAM-dependent methyltransferase
MHDSAFEKAQVFRRAYLAAYESVPLTVLDIGAAVVAEGHRSNRQAFENVNWRYLGLDIEAGSNVDLAVADPYDWREVADASADVVTCSQVLEHTEFFWITILEIARVLKPNGLGFIVAPGSGPLHRYPVDCWRFYDDGLPALARWADLSVLESAVQWRPVYRRGNQWRDAAIVLQRPVRSAEEEAKAAAKNRLVKAAHAGGGEVSALLGPAPVPQPSMIEHAHGLNALADHEQALATAHAPLSYKLSLAGGHLRAIRRLFATDARDIRAD